MEQKKRKRNSSTGGEREILPTEETARVTSNLEKLNDGKTSHAQHATEGVRYQLLLLARQALLPILQHVPCFYLRAWVLIPCAILSSPDTQKYIYFWLTPLIFYSPCNSEECFQCMIRHSQDLSVLLMQAVYLHAALLTSLGVSQITCSFRSLYFAWCFSQSGTSHNVLTKSC